MKKSVVLLSGGIDSAVCSLIAKERGEELHGLSFNYRQRHKDELECASILSKKIGFKKHSFIPIGVISPVKGNVFPGRNTIFLAYALSYAETVSADFIYLGSTADDYNGFPDCRPEYINAFREVVKLATKKKIEIETPLIAMRKSDIISLGVSLGLDFTNTLTCYDPELDGSCGVCGACKIRLQGFSDLSMKDPIKYR